MESPRCSAGKTALPAPPAVGTGAAAAQHPSLAWTSIQFYDHNFFDREEDTAPLLEVLAGMELPWWCFARADALLNLSERSWALVRKSKLRMAYIGAESPSDWLLHDVRKGTRTDQTLEAVEICRANGVIPELSFMLAPPQDPEGETERTFEFIRHIKRVHPQTENHALHLCARCRRHPGVRIPRLSARSAPCVTLMVSRWYFRTRQKSGHGDEWVTYWCHTDTPWLTPRLRARIRDFTTVLGCRFPTITDVRSPSWGKATLQALASLALSL